MSIFLGGIYKEVAKGYVNPSLVKFISKLKEEDIRGRLTKPYLKAKAKKFLKERDYDDYATIYNADFNGKLEVHDTLLLLIYDYI